MARRRSGAKILKFPRRRTERHLFRALRVSFSVLTPISPGLASRWAEFLFRTPMRQRRLKKEIAWLARGRFQPIPFRGGALASWSWGEGPLVVLVHGWTGHAGRLTGYVPALVEAGFSVLAFDAPGHGISPGFHSSLPCFAEALLAVSRALGPFHGLIAHSLGASAAVLAIADGLSLEKAIFLAPATDPDHYSSRFARTLRIPDPIRESMKLRIERRYGVSWQSFRLAERAAAMRTSLVVFHDRGDTKVPFTDGASIAAAWPGAQLVQTRGLGHHKILREPEVVFRAVEFLNGRSVAVPVDRARLRRES